MAIPLMFEQVADPQKPRWLTIRPPNGRFDLVKSIVRKGSMHTVCESAHCPNLPECWSSGTATFMVLGNTCTRGCRFCAVNHGAKGEELDRDEPAKIADACREWGLDYAVITSVDRDDLPDQGASHFAKCIVAMREHAPRTRVEVLTGDFRGKKELVAKIVEARPDVFGHNLETTKDLQSYVRDPRANYSQSLGVLDAVKEMDPSIYTKSALMLGLGESEEMVLEAFKDLRSVGCDFLSLGQYLRPSPKHLPVAEYVAPEKFDYFRAKALEAGFLYCAAGPFVRSSYKAGEYFKTRARVDSSIVE